MQNLLKNYCQSFRSLCIQPYLIPRGWMVLHFEQSWKRHYFCIFVCALVVCQLAKIDLNFMHIAYNYVFIFRRQGCRSRPFFKFPAPDKVRLRLLLLLLLLLLPLPLPLPLPLLIVIVITIVVSLHSRHNRHSRHSHSHRHT